MNEFDKKYFQLAEKYNYIPNELIQEGFLDDTGKFIKAKSKALYNKLVSIVKSWFNDIKDEKTAKEYSDKAKKLVGMSDNNNDKIVTQVVGAIFALLPILKKCDWFNKMCNTVKKYCQVFTKTDEKNNFIRYMKFDQKISNEQYKQMGYFDKQKQLYNYVTTSIEKNNIVSEEIITEDFGLTLIGLLVVLIIGAGLFIYCDRNWIPITEGGKKEFQRKEAIRNAEHPGEVAQATRKAKEKEAQQNKKLQELNLTQLTNILKGCSALK